MLSLTERPEAQSFFNMNREGAKDAKFLPEPGACRKRMAGFGSRKDAHKNKGIAASAEG